MVLDVIKGLAVSRAQVRYMEIVRKSDYTKLAIAGSKDFEVVKTDLTNFQNKGNHSNLLTWNKPLHLLSKCDTSFQIKS